MTELKLSYLRAAQVFTEIGNEHRDKAFSSIQPCQGWANLSIVEQMKDHQAQASLAWRNAVKARKAAEYIN